MCGATMVGINPTRRGGELAADIRHTDCQLLVTESKLSPLLDGLDLGLPASHVLVVDTDEFGAQCAALATGTFPVAMVPGDATALLVFTSGTSGAPKAAVVSQARLARYGRTISLGQEIIAASVCYARDADVPLQRAVCRLVTGGLCGSHDGAAAALLGVGVHR